MSKLIDYLNEHKWLKFISLILSFSPIFEWLKTLYEKLKTGNIQMLDMNYFGLISAILTTILLIFLVLVTFSSIKKLKETTDLLQAYKNVASFSSYYRAWRLYTKEGMGMEYYDTNFRDKVLIGWLSDEYKYVFSNIQQANQHLAPDEIYNLMLDYYGCTKKDLIALITKK